MPAKKKREDWLQDLYPQDKNIWERYMHLTSRELCIVAGAVLDAALTQLIEKRLLNDAKVQASFLGLEGAEGAAGTFSAKIQLAYLLGIIHDRDYKLLDTIRKLRNKFAHTVNVNFLSGDVQPLVRSLYDQWFALQANNLAIKQTSKQPSIKQLHPFLSTNEQGGFTLLLIIFSVQQAYYAQLIDSVEHLELVAVKKPAKKPTGK